MFICTFSFLSYGSIGGESSVGGGNAEKAEYISITKNALARLASRGNLQLKGIKIEVALMSAKFKSTKVEPTQEKLALNGQPKQALNYPNENRIKFNQDEWKTLSLEKKTLLAIHELWGLSFPKLSDENYDFSRPLVDVVRDVTAEDVAVAMAKAGNLRADLVKAQGARTKVSQYNSNSDDPTMIGLRFKIHVQTFENSSPNAVRIYMVSTDETGAVIDAKLIGSEGPVGP